MTTNNINDPVFVDRTGRRRRMVTLLGTAGGLVLAAAVLALVTGFTGVGPAALPDWDQPAAATPRPSTGASARPARTATRATRSVQPPSAPESVPPSSPASVAPGSPASAPPPSATPTSSVSPSPTPTVAGKGNSHRRVPTHTPSAHGPRKK